MTTILPDEADRRRAGQGRSSTNGHRSVSYADLAPVYLRQGYVAPIPLPQGRKYPPPSKPHKFTGRGAVKPSQEQITQWCELRGDNGIAFVLQDGQVVIEIDNYAKSAHPAGTGAATS